MKLLTSFGWAIGCVVICGGVAGCPGAQPSDPAFCGGLAAIACPAGQACVDDPDDGCDPKAGGADCGGICVDDPKPTFCGGIASFPCPDGESCIDDPDDDCDPKQSGADCGGICVKAEACGDTQCAPGLVCCNPVMGICTKPGGVCIQ